MDQKDKKQQFEKLNGNNFSNWSYRMKLFLQKEKCWDVINLEERPQVISRKKWVKMEQDANYYISIMVENNQLPFIKRTQSARQAWAELAKHHKKSSLTTKIRLLRKLYHEVLPPNGNMQEHLSILMGYYDELCEIGHVVDDKQFVSIIITSVGDDYDHLVTALDCRHEDELTLDLVKCKLLDEYERKIKIKKSEVQEESAYKIYNKPYYCDFCKTKGHLKKSCSKFTSWLEKKKDENKENHVESAKSAKEVENDSDIDYAF